jgi:hypothetical protein
LLRQRGRSTLKPSIHSTTERFDELPGESIFYGVFKCDEY